MCKYCDNIPEYPKMNILNGDLGISIYDNVPSICSETVNMLVHITNHIPISYCPICGKKLSIPTAEITNKDSICIYTDGAFRPSVNRGGWAYVVVKDNDILYSDYNGAKVDSNNKMELFAVLKAMIYIIKNKISATIYTDSQYVWGCATQGWKRKCNTALWDKFDTYINLLKQHDLKYSIQWVKGHADNKFNNEADKLAVKGSNLVLL